MTEYGKSQDAVEIPRKSHSSESQAEKRYRGEQLQEEMRRSWALIPNCWRMRITDSCGSRPADEIVITEDVNLLIEMKRKKDRVLSLGDLRTNQVGGLVDFEKACKRNMSFVVVSFQDDMVDTAYALRFPKMLEVMKAHNRASLTMEQCETFGIWLPRKLISRELGYDLRRWVERLR